MNQFKSLDMLWRDVWLLLFDDGIDDDVAMTAGWVMRTFLNSMHYDSVIMSTQHMLWYSQLTITMHHDDWQHQSLNCLKHG